MHTKDLCTPDAVDEDVSGIKQVLGLPRIGRWNTLLIKDIQKVMGSYKGQHTSLELEPACKLPVKGGVCFNIPLDVGLELAQFIAAAVQL